MSSNRHPQEQSGSQVWSKPRASPPPEGARIGVGEQRIGGSAGRRIGVREQRVGEARIKIMARIVRVKSWWPIGNLPVHRITEREVDSPLCEDADTPIRRHVSSARRHADTPTRFSCRQKFNSFSGT
jgi:hypothetical protein